MGGRWRTDSSESCDGNMGTGGRWASEAREQGGREPGAREPRARASAVRARQESGARMGRSRGGGCRVARGCARRSSCRIATSCRAFRTRARPSFRPNERTSMLRGTGSWPAVTEHSILRRGPSFTCWQGHPTRPTQPSTQSSMPTRSLARFRTCGMDTRERRECSRGRRSSRTTSATSRRRCCGLRMATAIVTTWRSRARNCRFRRRRVASSWWRTGRCCAPTRSMHPSSRSPPKSSMCRWKPFRTTSAWLAWPGRWHSFVGIGRSWLGLEMGFAPAACSVRTTTLRIRQACTV